MDALQLFKAGKLTEAIPALNSHLRDNPADSGNRTFLFQLLCFAGEYERAEKQLAILHQADKQAALGALLYHGALAAERIRQEMFTSKTYPKQAVNGAAPVSVSGKLNGKEFHSLSDADPRVGEKLEIFAASDYLWIPFADIATIRMEPPKNLRDVLWAPAKLLTGPAFRSRELGEVLLPAISPLSWQHPDDEVRLGRVTEWCEDEAGEQAPYGQKQLLVDGEEFPFLEIRELEIYSAAQSHSA